jgi:hypothetical protein
MKASKVASVVAALIATDAKPTEAQILAAIIAADKKGKDEGGLGPVEIEKKDKAKDAKACDGDDPEKTNDEEMDDKAKDEFPEKDDKAKDEMEDMDAEDDEQPKKSASGNAGAGGAEPAKDKKGMDAVVKRALTARDALHAARRDVEPVLGVVTYDSAAQVYAAALKKLGVAVDGVDASAYPVLFKLARDRIEVQTSAMASDAATVKTMAAVIPGYNRLK